MGSLNDSSLGVTGAKTVILVDSPFKLYATVLITPMSINMFCWLFSFFGGQTQYAIIDPGTGTLHT